MNALNKELDSHDPTSAAKAAGLRYVSDDKPGFTRKRRGRSFSYYDTHGALLRDKTQLERIRGLVIPPAWTQVWICPQASGHIQVTGRDQRGRKQYRYHSRWNEHRNEHKFSRMLAFGAALPKLRARVEHDLQGSGLSRQRVLAAVVRLLESTLIRVGNEEYARTNDSYGLTTLRNEHVEVEGQTVHFHFHGKSGVEHHIDLRDRRLAKIVHSCHELPGHELFGYLDAHGEVHRIDSADVNAYLHEITAEEFTAKDFRTWAGTLSAAFALHSMGAVEGVTAIKKNLSQAVKLVARRLGNTPAVCRKYYVHPTLFEAYTAGKLVMDFASNVAAQMIEESLDAEAPRVAKVAPSGALSPEEKALLKFLEAGLA